MRCALAVLVLARGAAALEVPHALTRRSLLGAAAVAAGGCGRAASAAQRGAEDAYAMQPFGETVCVRRTALGACAEQGTRAAAPVAEPAAPTSVPENYESELIARLREKTAANAEANALQVRELTLRNGMAGTFGPFSSEVSVMRRDGSFDVISVARFDRLKDAKKIVTNKNGLATFVEGFDPEAPEKKSGGWFGF